MSSIIEKDKVGNVVLLEGSRNYRTWKYSMKMVLMVKDLWEVVDGTETKPSGETEALAWTKYRVEKYGDTKDEENMSGGSGTEKRKASSTAQMAF